MRLAILPGSPAAPAGGACFSARHDGELVLALCWRIGAIREDEAVAALLEFVTGLQGPFGLWARGSRRELSHWVSFDVLRSFSFSDAEGGWMCLEPCLPFQPDPKRARRY